MTLIIHTRSLFKIFKFSPVQIRFQFTNNKTGQSIKCVLKPTPPYVPLSSSERKCNRTHSQNSSILHHEHETGYWSSVTYDAIVSPHHSAYLLCSLDYLQYPELGSIVQHCTDIAGGTCCRTARQGRRPSRAGRARHSPLLRTSWIQTEQHDCCCSDWPTLHALAFCIRACVLWRLLAGQPLCALTGSPGNPLRSSHRQPSHCFNITLFQISFSLVCDQEYGQMASPRQLLCQAVKQPPCKRLRAYAASKTYGLLTQPRHATRTSSSRLGIQSSLP